MLKLPEQNVSETTGNLGVEDFEVWIDFPRNGFGRSEIFETCRFTDFSNQIHRCSRITRAMRCSAFHTCFFSTYWRQMNLALSRTQFVMLLSFSGDSVKAVLDVKNTECVTFPRLWIPEAGNPFCQYASRKGFPPAFGVGKCNSCSILSHGVPSRFEVGNAALAFGQLLSLT